MAKKLINIQVEEEFVEKVRSFAKAHFLSLTTLIKLALQEYMFNHRDN
jgi:hypothetical protein